MGSGITAGTVVVGLELHLQRARLSAGRRPRRCGSTPTFVGAEEVAAATPPSRAARLMPVTVNGCAIATVDRRRDRVRVRPPPLRGRPDRAVGDGPADGDTVIDGTGLLATPGLVNSHHHLYQWATRGFVPDGTLFEWLTGLSPGVGAARRRHHPSRRRRRASRSSRSRAARPRPTTITCSRRTGLLEATIAAATGSACGSIRAAGRWTSGRARAGCRRTT